MITDQHFDIDDSAVELAMLVRSIWIQSLEKFSIDFVVHSRILQTKSSSDPIRSEVSTKLSNFLGVQQQSSRTFFLRVQSS
jgi:hypothetical protein